MIASVMFADLRSMTNAILRKATKGVKTRPQPLRQQTR
jgi:hypothetical protein